MTTLLGKLVATNRSTGAKNPIPFGALPGGVHPWLAARKRPALSAEVIAGVTAIPSQSGDGQ